MILCWHMLAHVRSVLTSKNRALTCKPQLVVDQILILLGLYRNWPAFAFVEPGINGDLIGENHTQSGYHGGYQTWLAGESLNISEHPQLNRGLQVDLPASHVWWHGRLPGRYTLLGECIKNRLKSGFQDAAPQWLQKRGLFWEFEDSELWLATVLEIYNNNIYIYIYNIYT